MSTGGGGDTQTPGASGSTAIGGSVNGGSTAMAGSANGGAHSANAGAENGGASTGGACSTKLESADTDDGVCKAELVSVNPGFLIDATEVTRGQYAAWLATKPALPPSTDKECGWNTSYELDAKCWSGSTEATVSNGDEHPVVCIDWCDARAYCEGVGKRLCGKIGGGSNATADYKDATKSQWYRACSSGGLYHYPYGDTRSSAYCNAYDYEPRPALASLPVGWLPSCQSSVTGYQGVFDLSGNVDEWEDSCDPSTEQSIGDVKNDYCLVRGGSIVGMANCDYQIGSSRATTFDDIGFRCCG